MLGFNRTSALCFQDRGKASHPCFLLLSCFHQESDIFSTAQQLPMLSFSWQTFSMFEQPPFQKKVLPWISSKSSSMYIVLTTSCPWAEDQLLANFGRVTRRALVYIAWSMAAAFTACCPSMCTCPSKPQSRSLLHTAKLHSGSQPRAP